MIFNPSEHLMTLQGGKEYLPVAPRVYWLRQDHPDWCIETRELFADEATGIYRIEATLKDAEGHVISMGRGRETMKGFASGPYEKAETIAIGRALAAAGYGTMESLDFDDDKEGKPADSGATKSKPTQQQSTTTQQRTTTQSKSGQAQAQTEDPRQKFIRKIQNGWVKLSEGNPSWKAPKHQYDDLCRMCESIDRGSSTPPRAIADWLQNAADSELECYMAHLKAVAQGGQ